MTGSSVSPGSRGGTWTRTLLRQQGIRTATDLLKAFPLDKIDVPADTPKTAERIHLDDELEQIGAVQVRTLVRVLSEEPGLAPVWNWSDRGVRVRCRHRQPQSVRACAIEHISSSLRGTEPTDHGHGQNTGKALDDGVDGRRLLGSV